MNNIDKQYQKLLQDIIDNGVEKKDRTGTGTISVFGRQIRHKMSEGFPLLTTKKMAWKTMVTELIWFLRGDTNIKYLVDNGCHIWDGDAYKNYSKTIEDVIDGYKCGDIMGMQPHIEKWFSNPDDLEPLTQEEFIDKIKTDDEFAKKWGELGPVYGEQWRSWEGLNSNTDQIANLINDLKNNPDSRRLMVNAWNVGELNRMVLPPCHYGFQVYTRELNLDERIDYFNKTKDPLSRSSDYHHVHMDSLRVPKRAISLMWNQRSVDTFLGLPFNIASYGLLLEIIAKEVNMVPDELVGNLGDVHLYSNHIEQSKEQIGRKYSHEEREEMLKNAMGPNGYEMAIKDLAPFGGGMSEYYEIYKIPYRTREPYKLPTLNINRTLFEFGKPDPNKLDLDYYSIHNFELLNYQSHPSIKAPLSN
jgi:thymidylate synthase